MTLIFLTSILILLYIPTSFTFLKTKNLNLKDHSSDPLSNNCKDQFDLSYKIQDIKSLNVPNLETEDDRHYAFVTTNPFGCLETGYFMVEGNSKLEIPYFLSKCKPGKFKLQLVLKDLLGNFMMKSLQPGKLNHWNVFSMNLPKNDNECVPYKVLIRSYIKNCTVIIKHVHIRPTISKQNDSKANVANETTLVRQKREGGDSEDQHDINTPSKEAITLSSISATEGATAPTTEDFCDDDSVPSSTKRAYNEEVDSRILKQLISEFIPQINIKVPKPIRKQSTAFSSETHSTEAENLIPDSTQTVPAEIFLLETSAKVQRPNPKIEPELKFILRPKSANESILTIQNSTAEPNTTKTFRKLNPQNRTKSVTMNPVVISDYFINKTITLLKKTLKPFIVDAPTSMIKSMSLALVLASIIIIVIVFFVYLACLSLRRGRKCSKCK